MRFCCVVLFVSSALSQIAWGQPTITKQEYDVYSVVLNDILHLKGSDKTERFLIYSETAYGPWILNSSYRKYKGLLANYRKKNRSSAKVEPRFDVKSRYSIVHKAELEFLLEKGEQDVKISRQQQLDCGNTWKYFHEKFKNSNGYYRFSRVGFSWDGRWALVETEGQGGCWTSNSLHLLRWTKSGWKVFESVGGRTIS
jgi:hypothetical protein